MLLELILSAFVSTSAALFVEQDANGKNYHCGQVKETWSRDLCLPTVNRRRQTLTLEKTIRKSVVGLSV